MPYYPVDMQPKFIPGFRVNRLVILSRIPSDRPRYPPDVEVQCDCGTVKRVNVTALNRIKSCGCWSQERKTKHGMHRTRLYHIWENMIQRCTNPSAPMFKHYGGRG